MGHVDYSDTFVERAQQSNSDWLPIGPDVTQFAAPIARRSDLVATVGPGVALGNPACFIPGRAELRLDTDMILPPGTLPGSVDVSDAMWQLENAEFMGAIAHEAGHAAHSRWVVPTLLDHGASHRQVDVIIALEEPRIEGRVIKHKPRHRLFLRATAVGLILRDFVIGESAYGASISAALLLARADAGILDQDDVTQIHDKVQDILGSSRLQLLRPLWQAFLDLQDRDIDGAIDIASRWLQVLGPDAPSEEEPMACGGLSQPSSNSTEQSGGAPGWLTSSAGQVSVAADTAVTKKRTGERTRRLRAAAAADAERREEGSASRADVFPSEPLGGGTDSSRGNSMSSRVPRSRPPSAEERRAATALAATLSRIHSVDGDRIRDDRPAPPGRLNTRSLIRTLAAPTAPPPDSLFRHYTIAEGPDQRLTVALMVDVSGSMTMAAEPMASAQWVLSHAATAVGARIATVHFGVEAYGVNRSWTVPETVDVYDCNDSYESFREAFLAIDAETELLDASGARLLVIASDGRYGRPGQAQYAEQAMTMCKGAGVQTLWLDFTARHRTSYGHGTVVPVHHAPSPVEVVRKIAEAVVTMQTSTL